MNRNLTAWEEGKSNWWRESWRDHSQPLMCWRRLSDIVSVTVEVAFMHGGWVVAWAGEGWGASPKKTRS